MGLIRVDVICIIVWHSSVDRFDLYSNVKDLALGEVLGSYIHSKVGSGGPDDPPERREKYTIKIGLCLEDDSFGTEHDCGNAGLALGIVTHALRQVGQIENRSLATYKEENTNG